MADPSQIASQLSSWLEWPTKLVVPLIALTGAFYTGLQYRRTMRWRSSDLAAQLIGQLTTDDELAFACQALDWGVGPMIVPTRYKALMSKKPEDPDEPTPRERGEIMDHDTSIMARALRINLGFDYNTQPAGLIYRYCFDRLFSHLTNVHRLLETGQIRLEHLEGLTYWVKRIAVYEYPPAIGKPPVQMSGDEVFQPFIWHGEYGYLGVIALGRTLKVDGMG